MSLHKTPVTIIGVIILLGLIGMAISFGQSIIPGTNDNTETTLINQPHERVFLDGTPLRVVYAETTELRTKGLAGIEELDFDEGMLFVFDTPDIHGFWMRGMKIPLDILWFDEDGVLVHIEENISPDTYPEKFEPNSPATYVLEVNAGYVEEEGVQKGDMLQFKKPEIQKPYQIADEEGVWCHEDRGTGEHCHEAGTFEHVH